MYLLTVKISAIYSAGRGPRNFQEISFLGGWTCTKSTWRRRENAPAGSRRNFQARKPPDIVSSSFLPLPRLSYHFFFFFCISRCTFLFCLSFFLPFLFGNFSFVYTGVPHAASRFLTHTHHAEGCAHQLSSTYAYKEGNLLPRPYTYISSLGKQHDVDLFMRSVAHLPPWRPN